MMSETSKSEHQSLPPKTWYGPPPPPQLLNDTSSLELLSQGAEARVWLVTLPNPTQTSSSGENSGGKRRTVNVGSGITVPQLQSFTQQPSPLLLASTPSQLAATSSPTAPLKVICKERFPKKYRHPQLDISLTRSRTKSEARSLIRCQRADVSCPNVFAIAHWSNKSSSPDEADATTSKGEENANNGGGMMETSTTSSCLFLECVEGYTVRQYFEQRSVEEQSNMHKTNTSGPGGTACDQGTEEPTTKKPRCEKEEPTTITGSEPIINSSQQQQQDRVTTVIDSQSLCVSHTIGTLVAKMHAAGVIHGDLTTSNIMLQNPPPEEATTDNNAVPVDTLSWKPQLVLIDFGLAGSVTNIGGKNNKKGAKKQQHNAEDKAVDLYVLERAFLSTHPESEQLVEEVLRGYRDYFDTLDEDYEMQDDARGADESGIRDDGEGTHSHVAKAVLNRLEQVRMRGRKRECFG